MRKTAEHKAIDLLVRFHLKGQGRRQPKHPARRHDYELTREWGWRHNILGFGISEKRAAGERQKGLRCLTLFVRRKLPNHRLSDAERIPSALTLDSVEGKILTDLVVLSGLPRAQQRDTTFRPLQPGANVGHSSGIAGTLGLLVQQGGGGPPLMLSCSHVLARSGNGASEGNAILQPLVAAFSPSAQVGTLTDTFTVFSASGTFDEDVALAKVTTTSPTPPAVPNMVDSGAIVASCSTLTSDQFDVGVQVTRNGIGSQLQTGETLAFQSAWSQVNMPFVGLVNFTGLVAYSAENADGDSGAVVVQSLADGTIQAVGLHVAGIEGQNGVSLFQPIGPIMSRYGLTLFTG